MAILPQAVLTDEQSHKPAFSFTYLPAYLHLPFTSSFFKLHDLLLFYSTMEEADFNPEPGHLAAAAWSSHLTFLEEPFNFSGSQFPYWQNGIFLMLIW